MLLHIMSLAGDIRRDDPPSRQPNPGRLAFCRIGLLRLRDAHLQTHALERGGADLAQGRGDSFARSLGDAAALRREKTVR
jgi:hypothetical protein